jgi:hypothetical protein
MITIISINIISIIITSHPSPITSRQLSSTPPPSSLSLPPSMPLLLYTIIIVVAVVAAAMGSIFMLSFA